LPDTLVPAPAMRRLVLYALDKIISRDSSARLAELFSFCDQTRDE
jgi:hypothetical protein